jgi:hypothetical protein
MTHLEGRIWTLGRELSDSEGRARTEEAMASWAVERRRGSQERAGFEQEQVALVPALAQVRLARR